MPYTSEQLQKAREYAAKLPYELARECLEPGFGYADHITEADKRRFSEAYFKHAQEIEQGLHDHNFTVWQRMHYYLTGECVAFLP